MADLIFENFAKGTLAAGGIDAVDTTIDLVTGHGNRFPNAPFRCVIWNNTDFADPVDAYHNSAAELVEVTSNPTANQLTGVTRGIEGTTAIAHNTGGKTYSIMNVITRQTLHALPQRDIVTGDMSFKTNSIERMKIDSNGEVQIGSGTPTVGEELTVFGSCRVDSPGDHLHLDCLLRHVRTTETISTGSITPTTSYVTVAAETGTADTLDTIATTGISEGTRLVVEADTGDTITIAQGGNLNIAGANFNIDGDDKVEFIHRGTEWHELSRSDNT